MQRQSGSKPPHSETLARLPSPWSIAKRLECASSLALCCSTRPDRLDDDFPEHSGWACSDKAAASRRTPKRWRVCRAPGTSRSARSAQARLRFVAARNQTDSMMTFGDTVVGHAATKRQQAAALRNAGASAERVVDREAFGSAQARLRFVVARNQTDSMMTFQNTVVRHAVAKRQQAAALRNASASAERPVHREALGVRKLACALLRHATKPTR